MMCLLILSLVSSASGEGPAPAETADPEVMSEGDWDQAAVTSLANELELTLQVAEKQSMNAPPQQTVLQQRDRDAAQAVIHRAREASEVYARRMRSGWDREDSEAYFRAVLEEVGHIWETAGDAVPAESAKPLIDRLRSLTEELRVWYEVE